MALRMVAPNRASDGRWFARKGIPEDVREAYARLHGVRREAHLKLPGDTPRHEAKVRLGEWEAEVETRIATLRARRNGEGQPLTRINAIALAGRWYIWFVAQHENEPGPARRWREMSEHLVWNVIRPEAPNSYEEGRPSLEWVKEPEVREAVRPQVAELARIATFLASEGIALNAAAYTLFVDAVGDNLQLAISVLERRANGDYSRDDTPDSFPPFVDGHARRALGLGCWDLFDAFVKAVRPAENTVQRWRAVFLEMQREFAETGAAGYHRGSCAQVDCQSCYAGAHSEDGAGSLLPASRRVFGWAKGHKHINENPFAGIKVDVRRKARSRETKAFMPAEVVCSSRLPWFTRTQGLHGNAPRDGRCGSVPTLALVQGR